MTALKVWQEVSIDAETKKQLLMEVTTDVDLKLLISKDKIEKFFLMKILNQLENCGF